MVNPLFKSLSLIDTSGIIIISVIFGILLTGIFLTLFIRARYGSIERALRRHGDAPGSFESPVLTRIVHEAVNSVRTSGGDVNSQAIVEQAFQLELRALLIGERFVKSMTGLVIILGLVGTFYGLSSSIGKLTDLLAGKTTTQATEVAASLTQGLTETLSGMSVAFTASLFGIVSAILMTLLGVFLNIGDRRLAVMVQIESYLDNELLPQARGGIGPRAEAGPGHAGAASNTRLENAMNGFSNSVTRLEQMMAGFEATLSNFSTSTRDFREFNHHLKDNIQRMSLSFGDLSESLRQQSAVIGESLRRRERG
jgi:methyl-accepting chemotaxis protein